MGLGSFLRALFGGSKETEAGSKIEGKLTEARRKVEELREEAQREARQIRESTEKELDGRRTQLLELEKRVADREEALTTKIEKLEQREGTAKSAEEKAKAREEELAALRAEEEKKLSEIAGLTQEQAAERMLQLAEERTREDILRRVKKVEKEGEKQLEGKAREIIASIIQRYGASQVSETVTSHVNVPDESMIGRIIGKEGRNIQHLERVTGCEIVVDNEMPNSIMISCFSPLRRQVAKTALERLIKDGRIHPGRIEGIVEDAKKEINEDIRQAGEAAVFELNILDFPDKLVHLVGRLKYRTSYSQNMLAHSVEVAHIARMLAEEMGADVNV
ncbi:MAG: Rnase Y domain-containing protein, partial [Patescibacteria group bacterium]